MLKDTGYVEHHALVEGESQKPTNETYILLMMLFSPDDDQVGATYQNVDLANFLSQAKYTTIFYHVHIPREKRGKNYSNKLKSSSLEGFCI